MSESKQPVQSEALGALRVQIDSIDQQLLSLLNQRAHVAEQVGEIKRAEGSPFFRPDRVAQVIEKIVEGKLEKFYQENCLLEQTFVKNPDQTIAQLVQEKVANKPPGATTPSANLFMSRYFLSAGITCSRSRVIFAGSRMTTSKRSPLFAASRSHGKMSACTNFGRTLLSLALPLAMVLALT